MDDPIVFTKKYKASDFNGALITNERICFNGKLIAINALWDTCSSESVISSNLADKLELRSIGSALLNGTNLSYKTKIYEIILLLVEKQQIKLQVTESPQINNSGIDILIGLDVISLCDFAISTDGEYLYMSVRYPSK